MSESSKPNPEVQAEAERWRFTVEYKRRVGHYPLYTLLDIFSRYVVGWMIAEVESSELAKQLIAETAHKQGGRPQWRVCTGRTLFCLIENVQQPQL